MKEKILNYILLLKEPFTINEIANKLQPNTIEERIQLHEAIFELYEEGIITSRNLGETRKYILTKELVQNKL